MLLEFRLDLLGLLCGSLRTREWMLRFWRGTTSIGRSGPTVKTSRSCLSCLFITVQLRLSVPPVLDVDAAAWVEQVAVGLICNRRRELHILYLGRWAIKLRTLLSAITWPFGQEASTTKAWFHCRGWAA